jgi:hypothetical protein
MTLKEKKRLGLVDGIALLLVTEGRSDVAAVSFYQTSSSIDFYYSKNRLCTAAEAQYIECILDMVRSYNPSTRNECTLKIVAKAISTCIRKVHKRIHKIALALADSKVAISMDSNNLVNLPLRHSGSTTSTLNDAIAKAFSFPESIPEGHRLEEPSDEKILADYFRCVLAMNASTDILHTRINDVSELIVLSYAIGKIMSPSP